MYLTIIPNGPSVTKRSSQPTSYVTSFRKRFFAYHHAVKHPYTSIVLS